MANSIDNSDDVIDSRDVIARIEELKDELNDKFEEEFKEEPIPFVNWLQATELAENHLFKDEAVKLLDLLAKPADEFGSADLFEMGDLRNTLHDAWQSDMEDRDTPDDAFDTWLAQVKENPMHSLYDEAREYDALFKLAEQAEGYGDWDHGETLIRRSHFVDYAKQLADDIGAVKEDATWPNSHIDWDAAANDLEADYTEVDFDGEPYLMRA